MNEHTTLKQIGLRAGEYADPKNILGEGAYYFLDDFALRDELCDKFEKTLLAGFEHFENTACRKAIEADGLSKMHLHFPVEKIRLIEEYLLRHLSNDLYFWTAQVATQNLKLVKEFFVDQLIVIRIHYPFETARKAKHVLKPPYPFPMKARAALADLKNGHMLIHRLNDFKYNQIGRWLGILDESNSYTPNSYHGSLPGPARAHGPHIDTWYGHSFDGINFWLSIDGVNENNTIILYPEMFGKPINYEISSMYLEKGIPLPKPFRPSMKKRQLLLFNPEMLHSTHLNISDETRIALTTRINPDTPRFNPKAGFHFQHWRSSKEILQKIFNKIKVFPASKYPGKPSTPKVTLPLIQKTTRVTSPQAVPSNTSVPICQSDVLPVGEKIAVDFPNAKLLVFRDPSGLRAISRICPHLGTDIIDGAHDQNYIYCPGHGVAFKIEDGTSACKSMKLNVFKASEREGVIFIEKSS